jgi:Neuraminidase (sialidase)
MALANGTTLVTYTGASLGSLHAAVSKDAGKSWKTSVIVTGGGLYDMSSLCHSKGGNLVYMTHLSGSMVDPITVTLRRSDDGGATWPANGAVTVTDPAAAAAAAYAAPSCVVDGDDVWVSYGLTKDPVDFGFLTVQRLESIQVAHSADGGKTFERYDAHDPSAGASFLSPLLALEDGGALDLTYIAGKQKGDTAATVRRSRSTDGGKTWCGSVVVHAPITFETSLTQPTSLSRRHGLAWGAGALYVTYPDNATDFSHVGFQRLTLP